MQSKASKILVIALFLIAAAGGSLVGCSMTEKLPCTTTDWYELGRRHGARGAPEEETKNLNISCGNEEEKHDAVALFDSGRSLGLAEYCTEENGFEMGRTGQKYQQVCPDVLEEAFLAGYKRGERASNLQSINEQLKAPGLSFARKGLLEGKKLQLQHDNEASSRELSKVGDAQLFAPQNPGSASSN